MKTTLAAVLLSVGLSCATTSATAQPDHRWQGGPEHRQWDASRSYDGRRHHERRLTRADYVYRGGDGRYYCRRSDGTTGLVVGGLAGAALGKAVGGGTISALLGAAGGAALGSSVDRGQVRCR
ncbi:MAG: hypothetical protein JWQ52_968 [Phenylobacterium sp.]|jgi:hypothetical protein|nr:hypothetical protein [Phenylobacterium sp.]